MKISLKKRAALMALSMLSVAFLWIGTAAAQVVESRHLVRALKYEVADALRQFEQGWRVEKVYYKYDLRLPEGEVAYKVDLDAPMRPGGFKTPVDVVVNGVVEKTIQLHVRVKRVVSVPVLVSALERGGIVSPGDIVWQEMEMKRTPKGLAVQPERLVGKMANRVVQAGTPLRTEWFSAPIAVNRGSRVEVMLKSGALSISTQGMAMQPGQMGESIVVRNLKTNRNFMAMVKGPGLVQASLR